MPIICNEKTFVIGHLFPAEFFNLEGEAVFGNAVVVMEGDVRNIFPCSTYENATVQVYTLTSFYSGLFCTVSATHIN